MPLPVTPLRHRLQVLGALSLSIGSVFILSRVVNGHHGGHCHSHSRQFAAPVTTAFVPPVNTVVAAIEYPVEERGAALKRAAANGDVTEMKRLLDKGADIHAGETDNDAPLLLADAHPEAVKLLLAAGANEADLSTACIAGAPNAVARMLANGDYVNPSNGTTPLYDALETTIPQPETRYEIVEKLLAAGANANAEPAPLTGAMMTCENDGSDNCLKLIRLLRSKGAKIDGTSLAYALTADPAVLDYLLSQPLEPGATAVALANGSAIDPSIVKKVAAKGVVWNWHDGETNAAAPLIDAIDLNDVESVRTFLEVGAPADMHLKDGRCPLGQAIDAASTAPAEGARIVELLLAHGASANRRFPDGRSPLFAAAEIGDPRIVNALLGAGARVNDKVIDETPLDAAIRSEHIAAARVIDGHGGRQAVKPTEE